MAANKVYDGTLTAALISGILNGLVNGETFILDKLIAAFDNKNAGSDKAVTVTGTAGSVASNYRVISPMGLSADISKVNATVTANSKTTTYNGQEQRVTGFTASGLVNGETESILTGVTTAGGKGIDVGNYSLIASGVDGNYALTFVDGALEIQHSTPQGYNNVLSALQRQHSDDSNSDKRAGVTSSVERAAGDVLYDVIDNGIRLPEGI